MANYETIEITNTKWIKIAESGDNITLQLQSGGFIKIRQEDTEPIDLNNGIIYIFKEKVVINPTSSNVWVLYSNKLGSLEIKKD